MRKVKIIAVICLVVIAMVISYSCKKDIGQNPLLAFTDKALLDSAKNTAAFMYYKNNPTAIYSGTNGPHGAFKLKFNKIANAVLTDAGKLPVGQHFPDGSLVVKEIPSNGIYALMYKREGSWIWSEINGDGSVIHSVTKDPSSACVGCHSQTGQRDLVVSFNFY
ncbi:MAG: hypothetical protein V4677_10755 [Bacteroidota bacterium]